MSEFQIGERIGEGQGEEFKAIAPNGMTVALKKSSALHRTAAQRNWQVFLLGFVEKSK
jgi:hypothetical protein